MNGTRFLACIAACLLASQPSPGGRAGSRAGVSGACSGPATFGTHAVPHRGSNEIFLAKLAEKAPAAKKE